MKNFITLLFIIAASVFCCNPTFAQTVGFDSGCGYPAAGTINPGTSDLSLNGNVCGSAFDVTSTGIVAGAAGFDISGFELNNYDIDEEAAYGFRIFYGPQDNCCTICLDAMVDLDQGSGCGTFGPQASLASFGFPTPAQYGLDIFGEEVVPYINMCAETEYFFDYQFILATAVDLTDPDGNFCAMDDALITNAGTMSSGTLLAPGTRDPLVINSATLAFNGVADCSATDVMVDFAVDISSGCVVDFGTCSKGLEYDFNVTLSCGDGSTLSVTTGDLLNDPTACFVGDMSTGQISLGSAADVCAIFACDPNASLNLYARHTFCEADDINGDGTGMDEAILSISIASILADFDAAMCCMEPTPECTLAAPACNACPDPACDISTAIDLTSGTVFNDSQEFGGGSAPIQPDYDSATNMGTLTLPAGGNEIYTAAGVSGLSFPDNVSEACLTADINVISGQLPFLFEFRIENGIPGQQLQFNAFVDGTGMCTIGGNVSDGVAAAGFTFVNGASYAIAAALAEFDGAGGNTVAEDIVVEISNISLIICAPDPAISGCTDPTADNFDMNATCDDGSCLFTVDCSITSGACNACAACEASTMIDFTTGSETFNDAGEFSGGTAAVVPNYDATTNTGTFILPVGSDEIFTVAGVRDLALPDDVTDICYTADINVVSGTAPINIEFRIEESANPGSQITWNATVDGTGMCSIGGSLADGVPVGGWPGFTNGTLYTTVFAVVSFGPDPPLAEQVEIEISNWEFSVCASTTPTAPAAPVVTDASCPDGVNLIPGDVDYSGTTCAGADDVVEYSLDGGATWSTTQPSYMDIQMAMSGNTVDVRCECSGAASTTAQASISPATCPAPCTLMLGTETVVCDANTAGADTYTVTIPFDNGTEGFPGGGGYTVTSAGTIGGDNPMVVQTGSITITFTEGTGYDYQITGIAGNVNETCDFTITGASPTCDPVTCSGVVDYPNIDLCNVAIDGSGTLATFTPTTCTVNPEVDNGDGTLTIISLDIYSPDAATGTFLGSLFESTTFAVSACDPLAITLPDNLTCAVSSFQFEIVTAINIVDAAGSIVSFVDDPNCTSEIMQVNHYPVLTATPNNSTDCTDATVDLLAQDGTICATETLTCATDTDVLNADFEISSTVVDPIGCSTLTASATCSGCTVDPPCAIAVTATQIDCNDGGTPQDPSDDIGTYEIAVTGTNTTGTSYSFQVNWSDPAMSVSTGNGIFNDVQTVSSPVGAVGSFTVIVMDDGDATCMGTVMGNFQGCGLPEVPTLSQWGLITLALLLATFGAITMSATKLAFAGTSTVPMPFTNISLPFNSAILRKALKITGVLALIGFAICFAIFGAIFMPDIIGVAIAGPIFAYLAHLIYLIEKR